MSGDESGKSQEARAFGRWLHAVTGIPVDWCDERYTTRQADNVLEEAQTTAKRRKRRRDMITTDSDFNPYQPLNVANSPPFSRFCPVARPFLPRHGAIGQACATIRAVGLPWNRISRRSSLVG